MRVASNGDHVMLFLPVVLWHGFGAKVRASTKPAWLNKPGVSLFDGVAAIPATLYTCNAFLWLSLVLALMAYLPSIKLTNHVRHAQAGPGDGDLA